jgi:hypothetical protein
LISKQLEIAQEGLTDEQAKTVKDAFKQLDKDGSGEVDAQELKGVLELILGTQVTDEIVQQFMEKVDKDNSGTVSLVEFMEAMKLWYKEEGDGTKNEGGVLARFLNSFKRKSRPVSGKFVLSSESDRIKKNIIEALEKHDSPNQKCVIFQVYINRILAIDDVSQEVNIDIYLKLNWQSKPWIGKTDEEFQEDERATQWWEPGVEVSNAIELEKQTPEEEAFWLEIPEAGILAYTQRYIGTISTHMDLHQFPFDKQLVGINFESFHWKEEDMKMIVLPYMAVQHAPAPGGHWITMSNEVKLHDWRVDEISIRERKMRYEFEDRTYSQVQVHMKLARSFRYYFQKVLVVLWFIVAMSWSVFYIDVDDISGRLGITVTLFLAAVAFNFVIGSALPKVPYNTLLDQNLLVSYSYIAATVIENIAAYQIFRAGEVDVDAIALGEAYIGLIFGASYILYNILWVCASLWKRKNNTRYQDPSVEISDAEREELEEQRGEGRDDMIELV